jgi:hypothetical protein
MDQTIHPSRNLINSDGNAITTSGYADQTAFRGYLRLAVDGNAHAQYMVGGMYFEGVGIEKSVSNGLFWFTRSAELGNPSACQSLVDIYSGGRGVDRDTVLVSKWLSEVTRLDNNARNSRIEWAEEQRPRLTVSASVIGKNFLESTYQSEPTESCLKQLVGDPKIKPLIGKLAFDLDKPQPLEMLANLSKANPKEKAALNFYSTEWQRCQELGADWRKRKLGPDIAALFSALQVDLSAGLADLYAGQISYGSAAKLRAKQWIEFKNGAEATERRHSAQAAENEKQRQIQMQKDTAAAQERAAQERSRQQAEVNQRQAEQDRIAQRQANEQERKSRDSDACKSQAAAARPAPKNDSQTTCTNFGGIVNCNTSSAQPSGFAAGFARGMANIDEARSFKNCMVARGWNPKD